VEDNTSLADLVWGCAIALIVLIFLVGGGSLIGVYHWLNASIWGFATFVSFITFLALVRRYTTQRFKGGVPLFPLFLCLTLAFFYWALQGSQKESRLQDMPMEEAFDVLRFGEQGVEPVKKMDICSQRLFGAKCLRYYPGRHQFSPTDCSVQQAKECPYLCRIRNIRHGSPDSHKGLEQLWTHNCWKLPYKKQETSFSIWEPPWERVIRAVNSLTEGGG